MRLSTIETVTKLTEHEKAVEALEMENAELLFSNLTGEDFSDFDDIPDEEIIEDPIVDEGTTGEGTENEGTTTEGGETTEEPVVEETTEPEDETTTV